MRTVDRTLSILATVLAGIAAAAPPTDPPLPEGAYPEWGATRAWRRSSSRRGEMCLNGLWRFRSEPRLREVEVTDTFHKEDIEESTLQDWQVGEIPGGTIRVTADSARKTVGGSSMKVELDIPKATNFYHLTRSVEGVPSGIQLVLRADMWIEMERGKLHIEIQDARDYKIYTTRSGGLRNAGKWQTVECAFVVPSGTSKLKILILRNQGSSSGCKGTVWIDNLRIVKIDRPVAPSIAPPTDDGWGFAKVPGSWKDRVYWHARDPARTKAGSLRFGWYERTVEVPEDWAGRRILARFDRLSTDARVYCDGVDAGTLGFMGGDVDITKYARPGKTLKLSVLVQGRDGWVVLPNLLTRPGKSWKAKLLLIGMAGDVFLASEPKGARVRLGRTKIRTSVNKAELEVTTELRPPVAGSIPTGLTLRCEVRDGATLVKTLEADVGENATKVTCAGKWTGAELWDVGKPKLYTMTASLLQDGRVIDESLPERFGFREFEIRGRFFYLNGVKLNLVPSSYYAFKGNWASKEAMRHWIRGAQVAGYNFVYLGETDRPGKPEAASHLLEVCDEMGMLAAVSPLGIGHSLYRRIDRPEVWAEWTGIVRKRIRKDWNHPSLVLWRMNMNLNCYKQDQNPLVLDGKMPFTPGSASALKEAAMLKSNAFVGSLDDTRPTYNHACGKTGAIYNLNNYLGWPELQDLREWLRVWAQRADKPLLMAEQATPYPGDFQMRDPTNWWANEPLMTEYGAILLGERSYELEEQDYVDYCQWAWDGTERKWRSSYGYFCFNYPPILDECSSAYYEVLLPAWRTWGISGGVNAWENTWRRLIKRRPNSVFREVPPGVPLDTDWANLQRPGFSADAWQYANGGGGEIRCLFDLGRPEEKEYLQPTRRGKVMPQLLAPLYAYIGGPRKTWFAQDHAFRSGEKVAKSVVLLNDLREASTFVIGWQVEVHGRIVARGAESATVAPAESAIVPFGFRAPVVQARTEARVAAKVTVNGKAVPVKPFALQFYPEDKPEKATPAGWAVFDPVGKTRKAFMAARLSLPELRANDPLPADVRVLVIGCNALGGTAGAKLFADLSSRVAAGLQVLVFEQTAKTLTEIFGLRCFTPGVRRVWLRDSAHPVVAGLVNEDLANWRGKTTLGPLDGPPEDLDQSQRWKRVWRCSQSGVVASTLVEKPQVGSFRPLLDTGFDLRYTALWEVVEGAGRLLFCQLDVTDRVGADPVADTLLRNLIADLADRRAPPQRIGLLAAKSANAVLSDLKIVGDTCPKDGAGKVLVLTRADGGWLNRNRAAVRTFLTSGGKVVAAGLGEAQGKALAQASGAGFGVASETRWLNPLSGKLPAAFRGVSPAGIHWRKKLATTTVTSVPADGWRSKTGVLATIPIGAGEIVWLAPAPEDFDPDKRPDLVFSKVNTERVYTIVLANLGVRTGPSWASRLRPKVLRAAESAFYTDKRVPRDDPYADMRW